LTAFVEKGEQGEGKPTRPGVPTVELGFIFANSVYTDIVPSNHFTRCASGESYEKEFPEDAPYKASEGVHYSFGEHFLAIMVYMKA